MALISLVGLFIFELTLATSLSTPSSCECNSHSSTSSDFCNQGPVVNCSCQPGAIIPNDSLDAVQLEISYSKHFAITPEIDLIQHFPNLECLVLCGIRYIEPGSLRKYQNISRLDLRSCRIKILEESTFKGLANLKSLRVREGQIKVIEDMAFQELDQLESLDISRNNITEMFADALIGMVKLEILDLSRNQMTMLPNNYFDHAPNLRVVLLESNKIQRIYRKAFWNLDQLEFLDLRNNSFQSFPELRFNSGFPVGRLDIDINGNVVRCDCHMKWLCKKNESYSNYTCGDGRSFGEFCNDDGGSDQPKCLKNDDETDAKIGSTKVLTCPYQDARWTTPNGSILSSHGEERGGKVFSH